MRFAELLFRFRRWVILLIILLGFWAPFDRMDGAHPGTTWLFLAGVLARYHVLSIAYSSIAVMAVAILLALLAALLRTWGVAYLGSGVAQDAALHTERVMTDGPFRYVRNPLYIGFWLHTLALSILMPPGGALFAVIAIGLASIVFVHIEEHGLMKDGGESYAEYLQKVPRFLAGLTPRIPSRGERPNWTGGFLGEIYFWGVCITYIAFAGRYNVTVLEQGILISLGISVVLEGILRSRTPNRVIAG